MAREGGEGSDEQGVGTEPAPKLTLAQRMLVAMPTVRRGGKSEPAVTAVEDVPAPTAKNEPAPKSEPAEVVKETTVVQGVTGPDDSETAAEGPKSFREKLKDATLKPPDKSAPPKGAARFQEMSDDELLGLSKRIDDKERLIGFIAAPIGAVLGVLYTALLIHSDPPLGKKNHYDKGTLVEFGAVYVVIPIITLVASFLRKRGFLATMLLLMAFSLSSLGGILFVLPFGAAAIWLFIHSYRMSKELQVRGLGPQRFAAQGGGKGGGGSQQRGRSQQRGGRPTMGRDRKGAAASNEPAARPRSSTANKRYTPPKPQPRKTAAPKPTKES